METGTSQDLCFSFFLTEHTLYSVADSIKVVEKPEELVTQPLPIQHIPREKITLSVPVFDQWLQTIAQTKTLGTEANLLALNEIVTDSSLSHENREHHYGLLWHTYRSLGLLEASLDMAHAWVSELPRQTEAWFCKGNTHMAMNEFALAQDAFTQSINLDPSLGKAYHNRGLAQELLGNYQGAVDDYTQTLNINPELWEAHFNRAGNYLD